MSSICLEASAGNTEAAAAFVEKTLGDSGCALAVTAKTMIIFDEIFSNIIKYSDAKEVTVKVDTGNANVILEFCDDGREYNPLLTGDPDTSQGLEEREIGGLGIYLVKKFADDVNYSYLEGKNILTITKNTVAV